MITIHQLDNQYHVYDDGHPLGFIELYDNPQHTANCYIKMELNSWDPCISEALFRRFREIAGRPLQVMVDTSNVAITDFLTAGGFVCKRTCYEVEACVSDYVGSVLDTELRYCSVGDQDYEFFCRRMFHHYLETHKAINPWTADDATFCAKLPKTAIYAKTDDSMFSVAFVENNEIAYVCSSSQEHFRLFAQDLISSLFAKHERIFFECDDCDWVAMILKSLFINQKSTGFCTYILA